MNRNLRKILLGFASFLLLSFGVNADEKSFLIGKATTPYILSTHYLSVLSSTECAYAIKYKYDVHAVEREVLEVLRLTDRSQVKIFLTSNKYRDGMKHQVKEVREMLDLMKTKGMDDKTACGTVIGMALSIYAQSQKEWTAAVQKYKQ